MKKLWSTKKFLGALFAGTLICICAVFFLFFNSKDTKDPVTFEYNVQTGIVTFQVDTKYELTHIQLHYGNVKMPPYDTNSQTILFSIFELGIHKSEFFTFQCNKKSDKDKVSTSMTYEVIRGSDNVVIILYKHNIQMKSWSYYNTGT